MSTTTNSTIANAVALIEGQIADIDAERTSLQDALDALVGTDDTTTEVAPKPAPKRASKGTTKAKVATKKVTKSKSTKSTKTKGTKKGATKKGAKRADGGRAADVLGVFSNGESLTGNEVAKALGLRPAYVYRVAARLVASGDLCRDGRSLSLAK